MRLRRRVLATILSVVVVAGLTARAARADGLDVLYVDNAAAAGCVDSGSGAGTQVAPFCTVQEAADGAVAGDRVEITAGTYGPVVVGSTGTAEAPIVFEPIGGEVWIQSSTGTSASLAFDGAAYVTFQGHLGTNLRSTMSFSPGGVTVTASSHITLDGDSFNLATIDGASSDVTVSRDVVHAGQVTVEPGSSGDVISTDYMTGQDAGVTVEGATDTDVTSNTIVNSGVGADPISVSSDATGTAIENNIVADNSPLAPTTSALIAVDASSSPATILDFNLVWPTKNATNGLEPAYSWAGTAYPNSSGLIAASGQGKHDLTANPEFWSAPFSNDPAAPEFNSANGAAPGMLTTDIFGLACDGDGTEPVTGAGSPGYCARGAVQAQFRTQVTASASPMWALTAQLFSGVAEYLTEDGTTSGVEADSSGIAKNFSVDWGDGRTSAYSITDPWTTHSYTKVGTYRITVSIALTTGGTATTTTSFSTAGSDYMPYGPTRILDTRRGLGAPKAKLASGSHFTVQVAGTGSIPAGITAVAVNLTVTNTTGGGYLTTGEPGTVSNVNYQTAGQTIANSAIVPVNPDGTIEVTNEGGQVDVVADVTGYFTRSAAAQYATVPLARILDTRHGVGARQAQIHGSSGVAVTVTGVDSIPSAAAAVAVHVTVTDTSGGGWIAAEPDGAGTPSTSTLNYGKGQTVSNTVIVPVGKDGKIELYNGGTAGAVDLIADVFGYFSANAPDAYLPYGPQRVVDTRPLPGFGLWSDQVSKYYLAPDGVGDVIPENAAVVANVTLTNTTGSGYITIYPDGSSRPLISNLNYLKGQTVAGMGILASTTTAQYVDVYNAANGSANLIVDLFGYFANN